MKRKFLNVLIALVLVLSFSSVMALPAAAQSTWYVATTGNDTTGDGSSGNPWATIGKAITMASSGDTIMVAAGTYTESLTINKGLTIQGVDSANTTINGAHTANVSDVSLSGFEFSPGAAVAIKIDSSGAAVSNFSVTNCIFTLTTSPVIGVSIGYGVGTSPNAVSNVTIDNNTFNGPTNKVANPWKIGGEFSPGLPIGCQVTNVDFTNNTVNKCSTPINLDSENITDILIDGNTFTNTDGVVYVWGEGTPTGVLSQFVFTNNDCSTGNTYGVAFFGNGGGMNSTVFTDANFGTGNRVNYNDFSNIAGGYGLLAVSMLANLTSYTLDAEYNWWGGVAGPQHGTNPYNDEAVNQGNGLVSADVDFLPWMIHDTLVSGWNIWSTPIAAATGYAGEPDTNTVTEALDFWDADSSKVTDAYYFDSSSQAWATPTSLTPLQAVYLKVSDTATIDVCVSDSNYAPPGQTMHLGWNLVGTADWDDDKLVDAALLSAYYGTGAVNLIGYQYVISPSIHQTTWTFTRGDNATTEYFVPTEGYWVYMVNQGVLNGFTYTPITPLP